jgi:hypothetical protein
MGYLKKVGNISVDGTKIHANAGRHSAVSYKRTAEMIAEAEKEVGELLAKAEEAGLTIPEDIQRQEDRKAALEGAKREMERRYEEAKREREEEARENESGDSVKKRGGGGRKRSDGTAAENGGGEENI